jgi:hypothetical protein
MLVQFDYVTIFSIPFIMLYFLYNLSCRKYMRSRCKVNVELSIIFGQFENGDQRVLSGYASSCVSCIHGFVSITPLFFVTPILGV